MQFFYMLWIIFREDRCPSPFYCRTSSSVAFTKGRISVKWWWETNVIYLINFLQLYFFTAEYERIIKYIRVSRIWNAIHLNCVKNIIVLKVFQKYCFIGNTFCDIYRGHGYIETLLELLKFSENSLVLSTSTKTFQQEQQKRHSIRVRSATHCDRQYHQQGPVLCYVIEPEFNRAVLERVNNFILLLCQNHYSDNYSSRTEDSIYP